MMNPVTNSSTSIRWTLRYVEWILLITVFLARVLNGSFNHFEFFAFFTVLLLLSFVFPINRPPWQRRGYIFLEILLVISAILRGLGIALILYLLIAKSCFLLDRKGVVLTVVTTEIAYILTIAWRLQANPYRCVINDPSRVILVNLVVFLGVSLFVVLFSFMMIAEQKSRQKAEALTRQVETLAATLERTRIARDIHDSLGHTLTSLNIQLELARKLYQRDPDQAQKALDTAKHLANRSHQDVRRALQTMRTSDFDLKAALVALVEQVKQSQPLNIQLALNLPQLPLQTSHQLYCIVQEGLTNIQKHAHAKKVSLLCKPSPEGITLELADDGIGFDLQAPRSGFGLLGMQERVQSLGGQLKVNSALGQGTRIQVTIPA